MQVCQVQLVLLKKYFVRITNFNLDVNWVSKLYVVYFQYKLRFKVVNVLKNLGNNFSETRFGIWYCN